MDRIPKHTGKHGDELVEPTLPRRHKYTESLPSIRLSESIGDLSLNLRMQPPIIPPSLLVHVKPPAAEISASTARGERVDPPNSNSMNQKIFAMLRERSNQLQRAYPKKSDASYSSRRFKPVTSQPSPKHLRKDLGRRLEVQLSMQLQSNNVSKFIQASVRVENLPLDPTSDRRSITELYKINPSETKMPQLFAAPKDSTRAGSGEFDASDLNTSTLNSPLYLKPKYSVRKSIVRGKYYDQGKNEHHSRADYIEEQIIRSSNGSQVRGIKRGKQPSDQILPSDSTNLQVGDSQQDLHPTVWLTQSTHRPESRRLRNPQIESFKTYRSQMELIKAKIVARKSTESNYRLPPGVMVEPSDFNQFYKTLSAKHAFLSQAQDYRWNTPGRTLTGDSPTKNSSLRRRMTSKLQEVSPALIGLSSSQVHPLPEAEEADGMSSSAFTSEQITPLGTAGRKIHPKSPKKHVAKLNPKPAIRKFNAGGILRKESVEPISPARVTLNGADSSEAKSPQNASKENINSLSPKRRASEVHLLQEFAAGFAGFANLINTSQHKRKSMLVPSTIKSKPDLDSDKNKFHMNPKMLIVDSLNPMRNIVKLEQPVGLMHYETENKPTHYWSYWMKQIYQMLQSFDLFDPQTKVGYYSLYEPKGISSRSKEELDRSGKKLASKLTLEFGEDEKPGLSSAAQSSAEDPLGMFSNKQRKNMALLMRLEVKLGVDLYCESLDVQRNYREIHDQVFQRSYQYAPNDPATLFLYREQLMQAGKNPIPLGSDDFSTTCADMSAAIATTATARSISGTTGLNALAVFTERLAGVSPVPEAILGGTLNSFPDLHHKSPASPRQKPAATSFTTKTFTLIPPSLT